MATYEAPRKPDAVVHTGFFTLEIQDLAAPALERR